MKTRTVTSKGNPRELAENPHTQKDALLFLTRGGKNPLGPQGCSPASAPAAGATAAGAPGAASPETRAKDENA